MKYFNTDLWMNFEFYTRFISIQKINCVCDLKLFEFHLQFKIKLGRIFHFNACFEPRQNFLCQRIDYTLELWLTWHMELHHEHPSKQQKNEMILNKTLHFFSNAPNGFFNAVEEILEPLDDFRLKHWNFCRNQLLSPLSSTKYYVITRYQYLNLNLICEFHSLWNKI